MEGLALGYGRKKVQEMPMQLMVLLLSNLVLVYLGSSEPIPTLNLAQSQ